jgi:fructose-bisphosphate aldolase class II
MVDKKDEDAESHHSHHSYHELTSMWQIPGMQAGVMTGMTAWALLQYAKTHGFALPAFGCSSPGAVISVLQAVETINFPLVISVSMIGAACFCGDHPESDHPLEQAVSGAISAANQVRQMAVAYSVPVILQTSHISAAQLPWLDGVMKADWEHFRKHGEPLFSMHMLDLTRETLEVNLATCANYFMQMQELGIILDIGLAVEHEKCHEITKQWPTGLASSGIQELEPTIATPKVAKGHPAKEDVYCALPEDVYRVWRSLLRISERFLFSFTFGEKHSIAKPKPDTSKVTLRFLEEFQEYTARLSQKDKRSARTNQHITTGHADFVPLNFGLYGVSNADKREIQVALGAGVLKVSVNMNSQWTRWIGILSMYTSKEGFQLDRYIQGKRHGLPHHGKRFPGDIDREHENRMAEIEEMAEVEFHWAKQL